MQAGKTCKNPEPSWRLSSQMISPLIGSAASRGEVGVNYLELKETLSSIPTSPNHMALSRCLVPAHTCHEVPLTPSKAVCVCVVGLSPPSSSPVWLSTAWLGGRAGWNTEPVDNIPASSPPTHGAILSTMSVWRGKRRLEVDVCFVLLRSHLVQQPPVDLKPSVNR